MQIDKPDGDEFFQSSVGGGMAPLPPEPPQPMIDEADAPAPIGGPRRATRRPRRRSRSILGTVLIGGATIAAALLGRASTTPRAKLWYRTLRKPSWTPPDEVFGLVWPALYALSAISAWRIWKAPPSTARSAALGLWTAQIASNAAWTQLFFGRKEPAMALADIKANLGSAAGYAFAASKVDKTAGLLMLPYVVWVTFASTINASVVRHNTHGPLARLGIGG